jgi:hypothetical protein
MLLMLKSTFSDWLNLLILEPAACTEEIERLRSDCEEAQQARLDTLRYSQWDGCTEYMREYLKWLYVPPLYTVLTIDM